MLLWNVRKKNQGFTLIEVLVVGIIFAILSAVAVPNLLGLLYKARTTEGLASVESAIKEAQRQAKRQSKTCAIQFGTTTVTRFGRTEQRAFITTPPNVPGVSDFSGCLLDDRILPSGVILVIEDEAFPRATPPTPVPEIRFSAKGNTADNGTIAVVYHPDVAVANERCLELNGIFGDISTGFHVDTSDTDRETIGDCNTN